MFIISNEKSYMTLNNRLKELLPEILQIDILVGFFYFSGLDLLYESIKKNEIVKLRVLIGLEVDKGSFDLYEYGMERKGHSRNDRINSFLNSLKKVFNNPNFDTKEFYEKAKFFLTLLENERLLFRKTKEPNHAKLYIFYPVNTKISKGLFITGSSNFTKPGLKEQNEFNIEIQGELEFEKAKDYFEELWKKSIPLNEDSVIKEKIIKVIKEESFLKNITPFEAYVFSLKHYIDSITTKRNLKALEKLLVKKGFKVFKYQMDAVSQSLAIIEENNGVIIADVVGLGKSIIASSIAYMLNKRGIIIAPPHLMDSWKEYVRKFNLNYEVFSLGKLEDVVEIVNDIDVVIVDEAHRFRNQSTKSYDLLSKITKGKQVILLTATPFNNSPSDVFSLLKLFQPPKKSTIVLEENLLSVFRKIQNEFEDLIFIKKNYLKKEAIKKYEKIFNEKNVDLKKVEKKLKKLSKKIKSIIEPVVIRRNRLDLQENPLYKKEVKELPVVKDPIEAFYELEKKESEFYDKVITQYFAPDGEFIGAIYVPHLYDEKVDDSFVRLSQTNLKNFMRSLIVRRFESSFASFKQSIENFKSTYKNALAFIEKHNKFLLNRKLMTKLLNDDEELDFDDETYVYDLENSKNAGKFKEDIQKDIDLFGKILKELDELKLIEQDPKIKKLKEVIKEYSKDRKIVIFSEFKDTIVYLEKELKKDNELKDCVLAAYDKLDIKRIKENFDASSKGQKDDYKILLATDKLSEGFNLSKCGVVVNYDIPWNPVRVIQRVGRINRIGQKVYDELYIINFFPTEKGENLVKQREIAQNKLFLIHNSIGEDTKIFSPEEEPTPSKLYQKINSLNEEESFFTKVMKDYEILKEKYPKIFKKKFPNRVKVSKIGEKDEQILLIKKGKKLFVNYKDYESNKPKTLYFEEIYDKIKVSCEEKPLEKSDKFWEVYEELKTFREKVSKKTSQKDPEVKALNLLKSTFREKFDEELNEFIENLIKDIEEFGWLPIFTLKEIANLNPDNAKEYFVKLMNQLGGKNYLKKYENITSKLKEDVLIAIENRRENDKNI